MIPKFKYNQRVRVISGFYEGYDARLDDFKINERVVYSNNGLVGSNTIQSVEYKVALLMPNRKNIVCAQAGMGHVWINERHLDILEIKVTK